MKTLRLWLFNRKRLHSKPHTVASFNRQTFDFHSVKYFQGLLLLETCVGDADVNVAIHDSCDDWQRRPPTGHRNHDLTTDISLWKCAGQRARLILLPASGFSHQNGSCQDRLHVSVTSLILSQEGCEMRLESQIAVVTHSLQAETAVHVQACAHAHSDKFAAILN